jgi:acetyl-CoA carboxylase carboxyltransferase component
MRTPEHERRERLEQEFARREAAARRMGGPEKLARRAHEGLLNARQRIERLFDADTFIESGLFATSANPADRDKSPGDGKLAGFGKVNGREAAVVSNDFTVLGASSGATNGRKIAHMKRVATQRGMPLVFLGESSGARMPDHMGSRGMGALLGNDGLQYQRLRETPWVSATLGPSYGSSSWYAVLSDFSVMRKGAVLAVSSALLASLARRSAAGGCMRRSPGSPTWWWSPTRKPSTPSSASSPICRATTTRRRR